MEKKLELRHLAAYLPYELKCKTINEYESENIQLFIGCNFKTGTAIFKDNHSYQFEGFSIDNIKPILRPLSELTKEIEVNGETFTPKTELPWKLAFQNPESAKKLIESGMLEHRLMEKLLSWHFDIFGLIDAGLAIDINTLEKNNYANIY